MKKIREISNETKANNTTKITKNKICILIASIIAILICISTILSYFSYIKRIQAFFTIKPTYKLTYEYYEIDTDGSKTKLDKTETITLFANDVITLGEDEEYILTSDRYSSLDFEIEGDEEDGVQVKREIGYSFEMPSKSIVVKQNYYLKPLAGNVIIHHYESGTINKVAEDEQLSDSLGVSFSVSNLMSDENKLLLGGVEQTQEREYLDNEIYTYNSVDADEGKVTINANDVITGEITSEDIVITYYYTALKCNITGEVVGGNGQISDVDETVIIGRSSTKDIIFTPNSGYRVEKIMVYSGDEITAYNNGTTEGIGTQITQFDEDSHTLVSTMEPLQNVTEDKHIVVTFEERPYVAQIVAVPTGVETLNSELYTDGRDVNTILNHKYYTLEDAINDAYIANEKYREIGGTGTSEPSGSTDPENPATTPNTIVEIKILTDIRNESVTLKDENNVSIDLNGYQINSNSRIKPTMKVTESTLIVTDKSDLQTGKILSKNGIGVFIAIDGELTLGIDEKPISITSPEVEGKTYGVYKEFEYTGEYDETGLIEKTRDGIFNFYDGRLRGEVALFGKEEDKPAGRKVFTTPSIVVEGKEDAYLTTLENVEAVIGKREFRELEQAVVAANTEYGENGEEVVIEMVTDAVVESKMTINADRKVKLNLNDLTVSSGISGYMIENKGTFTIENDGETGKNNVGVLKKTTGPAIVNNSGATLNIEHGKITASNATGSSSNGISTGAAIVNNGTMVMNNGIVEGLTANYAAGIINNATCTINGGTISGKQYSFYNKSGTLVYNNGTIYSLYNYSTSANPPAVTINGGKITRIYQYNGTMNIYGTDESVSPIINNNSSATINVHGGKLARLEYNNGTFNMYDGSIIGSTTKTQYSTWSGIVENTWIVNIYGGYFENTGSGAVFRQYYANTVGAQRKINFQESENVKIQVKANSGIAIMDEGNTGQITIDGGTYTSNSGNVIYANYASGSTTLKREININSGLFKTAGTVVNNNTSTGTININGGRFENTSTNTSILANSGTMNIGKKNTAEDSTFSQTEPTILSKNYGINNSGTINFYDGQLITSAEVNPLTGYGGINEIETTAEIDGTSYELDINMNTIENFEGDTNYNGFLRTILAPGDTGVARILKTSILQADIETLDNSKYYIQTDSETGNQYYVFKSIKDAVDVCNDEAGSTKTTIEIISNIDTVDYITTKEGQNIIIDINGKRIRSYSNNTFIQNNGTIEIIDSLTTGNIYIKGNILNNNGNATLNATIQSTKRATSYQTISSRNVPNNNAIYNNGYLNITGGTITTYQTTVIKNANKLVIDGGTIIDSGSSINWLGSINILNVDTGNCIINGGTITNSSSLSKLENYTVYPTVIVNVDNATLKITDGSIIMNSTNDIIWNKSVSKYVENVSEPAVYISGGSFTRGATWIESNSYNLLMDASSSESDIWIKKAAGKTLTIKNRIYCQSAKLTIENITTGYTIKSTSSKTIINNSTTAAIELSSGEDEIYKCTTGAITKSGSSTLDISESTVNAKIENSGTGTITIKNSNVKSTASNTPAVKNSSTGTILIPSTNTSVAHTIANTTIESTTTYAVQCSGNGTITIGTKGDGVVDQVYPKITGKTNGLYNSATSAAINFYDGSIIGQNSYASISGIMAELEEGYAIAKEKSANGTIETATLKKLAVAKILKSSINSANLSGIDYETLTETDEEENEIEYYTFYTIQDAVNACTNEVETTITLIQDITYTESIGTQTIPQQKEIIIDFNGHKIDSSNENCFVNNGKVKMLNNLSGTTAKITSNKANFMVNTGTLSIDKITITQKQLALFDNSGTLTINQSSITTSFAGGTINDNYCIQNTGTLTLTGNTVSMGSNTNLCFLKNNGNATISGGTYSRNESNDTNNFIVNNIQTGDATIQNVTLNYLGYFNTGTATLQAIDNTVNYGSIYNNSTKVTADADEKPAIRIKGGTYKNQRYNQGYQHYSYYNYAGEMIFENNTETNKAFSLTSVINAYYGNTYVNGGKVIINSGYFENDITVSSGTLEINGTFNETTSTHSTNKVGGIGISSGATANIYGGKVNYTTITNNGELNIGKDDNAINNNTPELVGQLINNGILNFYDGKITDTKIPVTGKIDDIPENCELIYTINGSTHTYTLSKTDVVATIGEGANLQEFTTLKSALLACTGTENTVINMQKSIGVIENNEFTINSTQNITLNMNGNKIISNCTGKLFTNNGKLEIKSTNGTGYINLINGISNLGTLKLSGITMDSGTYIAKTLITNEQQGSIEVTGGTFNIYAGRTTTNQTAYAINSTSTGNISVTGGTFNCYGYASWSGGSYISNYAIAVNVNNTNDNKPTVTIAGDVTFNNIAPGGDGQWSCSSGVIAKNAIVNISGGTNGTTNNQITNSTAIISGGSIYGETTFSNSTATITGGTLSGAVNVNGTQMTMTGGTISGTTTTNATASLEVSGTAKIASIVNSGTLTVTGTSEEKIKVNGKITNKNKATLENAEVTCTGDVALQVESSNGTYVKKGTVITSTNSTGINVNSGNCNVYDGAEVYSTNATAIYVQSGASITIGVNEAPVSITSPIITGGTYGINNAGTLNFYDGYITGTGSGALGGTVPTGLPTGYAVQTADNATKAWLESSAISSPVAQVGDTNYRTLQSAIQATASGTILIKENIVLDEPITIQEGKTIAIDLRSCKITYDGTDAAIQNHGTLVILDTAEDGTALGVYGMIKNDTGPAIQNEGTLTIGRDNDMTVYSNSPRIIGGTYAVVNTQHEVPDTEGEGTHMESYTFRFLDGVLKGATAAVSGQITETTTITGYTLTDQDEVDGGVTYHTKFYEIQ